MLPEPTKDSNRTTARGAAGYDISRNVGGDELFWRGVSGTQCHFGGDDLGVAAKEQNGQRTGDAPAPPMGRVGQVGRVRRTEWRIGGFSVGDRWNVTWVVMGW